MMRSLFSSRALTLRAFFRAQRLARKLKNRADIDAWQAKKISHLLRKEAIKIEAYKGYTGASLNNYPIMDKMQLMTNFHAYNCNGVNLKTARNVLAGHHHLKGLSVGASTGTSGNRGLYVVSDRERFQWLGVMLAKALPDVRTQAYRVAVILPTNSSLYDSANESGRLKLKFFDLNEGLNAHNQSLEIFNPNVIIAPPKVLVSLVRADVQLTLKHVFSGAEVLDPMDRTEIQAGFGQVVREIYMATEGFFGLACEYGNMHLAEDYVKFEWENNSQDIDLKSPIITDFTRRTQIMLRYRMNDLLRLCQEPCPCGSPFQRVKEIVGRKDDVFFLRSKDGRNTIMVTPDVIRNAVLKASENISDFRVVQKSETEINLTLPVGLKNESIAAKAALINLFDRLGTHPNVLSYTERLVAPHEHKLRRVLRDPAVNELRI